MKLPMTSLLAHLKPTISFDPLNKFLNFHTGGQDQCGKEVRAGRQRGGNVGVGCVKTLALTPKEIDKPLCVERNTSDPPSRAK